MRTGRAGSAPYIFTEAIGLLKLSDATETTIAFPTDDTSTNRQACLASAYGDLSAALSTVEAYDDAEIAITKALERMRPLVGADPHNANYHNLMADLLRQQASVHSEHGRQAAAVAAVRESIEHRQVVLASDSASVSIRRAQRDDYGELSLCLMEHVDNSEGFLAATETYRKLADELARDYPLVIEDQVCAALACFTLSMEYLFLERTGEAEVVRQEFVALASELAVEHGQWEVFATASVYSEGKDLPQVMSQMLGLWLPGPNRAGVDGSLADSRTSSKFGAPISPADAKRISNLHDHNSAIGVSLYHDRLAEAQEHHKQAVACCNELLESLTNEGARRHVVKIAASLQSTAELLPKTGSEKGESNENAQRDE